ncbi:hypothetical protein LEN26_002027 [Aphanomyces euteiches]|nr:hypothetical protein AeMF1_014521 [Aphanomyces euteiches]KAH9160070.1 hypothetical protein LEN26_002027 [Aphanomyces euteiches]KAH9182924.1 hypothetical protein AeNC1_015099 [Aphanomyces euteiches]
MRFLHKHGVTLALWIASAALVWYTFFPKGFVAQKPDQVGLDALPFCLNLPDLQRYFVPIMEDERAAKCRLEAGYTFKVQLGLVLPATKSQIRTFFASPACKDYFEILLDVYVNKLPDCRLQLNKTASVPNSAFKNLSYDMLKELHEAYLQS